MTDRLRVGDAKRDVAIGEVTALLGVVEEAAFRGELKALAAGIEAGELGPGAQATLEQVLELGLQAGRIRAVYGPGGEQPASPSTDAFRPGRRWSRAPGS